MDVLILRLIHIVAGAFWVGAVFSTVLFLQPTAAAVGPSAGPFQVHLVRSRRFPDVIILSAIVTVLAGIWLLWITTNGLDWSLALDESRLGFTIGGIAGILTLAFGGSYVYPRTKRVANVVAGIMAAARPPTAEEQAQLGALRTQLTTAGWWVIAGLAIAVICMATARYWSLVL